MIFSKITALGAYVPQQKISNHQLAEIVDTDDEWIVSRSGIGHRHFSQGEDTSDLATKSAELILERAGKNGEEIDLIIVATVSPDYSTPSTACIVQANIGATNAVAFDVGAACSGFIFAMSIADKYIKSGVYKNALVIGSEVLSKHLDFNDRSTCVLFADGAGGALLEASEENGYIAETIKSDGRLAMSLTAGHKPVNNAFCEKNTTNAEYLYMDGRAIFDFATRTAPKSIVELIEKTNYTLDDIDWVVAHQANKRIIDVVARKLKMPIEKFYMNLYDYGNTSSATIPIALNEMAEKGLLKRGQKIIVCGFGAGVTWGSALIEY